MYKSNTLHDSKTLYMRYMGQYWSCPESETDTSRGGNSIHHQAPIMKFGGHKDEIGIQLFLEGLFLVIASIVFTYGILRLKHGMWIKNPFVGHTAGVEDLQWSPTEADVFASCSADGSISIWDTRLGKSPAASVNAHNTDVNVISWNRLASCMIASGSDDGTFSILDLRLIKEDSLVAHFEYHKHHEASTLAVSSADNQLTIWELSLERDEEEEAEFRAKVKEQANAPARSTTSAPFRASGSERFEGNTLAPADPRDACVHSCRWFQCCNACKFRNHYSRGCLMNNSIYYSSLCRYTPQMESSQQQQQTYHISMVLDMENVDAHLRELPAKFLAQA